MLAQKINKNFYTRIFLGVFMILLDLLIEPVAPLLGFWVFDLSKVPLQKLSRMGICVVSATFYISEVKN